MVFNSLLFGLFFIVVLFLYYRLPHRWQNHLILVASYVFYGYVHPWFLILIGISTVVDYAVALAIEAQPARRKGWLWVSLASNLGMLGAFKYFGFFADNVWAVLDALNLAPPKPALQIALPVGIIASGFAEEIHRRDFVVTWGMVARVPLFAELNASEIADIMRLLRAQQVEPGAMIARRGDPAHSMYFIAAGEVDIELPHDRVRLGVGQFFGEIAVLRRARRSANVTAVSRASLLVLDARDLHALMERDSRVASHVREVARGRLGRDLARRGPFRAPRDQVLEAHVANRSAVLPGADGASVGAGLELSGAGPRPARQDAA